MAWYDPLAALAQRVQQRLGIADKDRWLLWVWPLGVLALLVLALAGTIMSITPEVPLRTPRPAEVYSADGVLLAQLAPPDFETPAPYDSLRHLTNALEAAYQPGYRKGDYVLTSAFSRLLVRQLDIDFDGPLRSWQMRYAAYRMEREYPRDTILAAVLHYADFGQGRRGIVRAARFYFDKRPQELSIAEAALLAGMLEAPTAYNPRRDSAKAAARRNEVLDAMAAHGMVSADESSKLRQQAIRTKRGKMPRTKLDSQEPYFTRLVADWAEQTLDSLRKQGQYAPDLYTAGLRIYTTLDTRIQAHAREAVLEHLRFLDEPFRDQLKTFAPWRRTRDKDFLTRLIRRTARYQAMQEAGIPEAEILAFFQTQKVRMQLVRLVRDRSRGAEWTDTKVELRDTALTAQDSLLYYTAMLQAGLLSAETNSHRVRAYVAGLNYTFLPLDHLTQTRRQPGSAFKPFVYAAALDSNIAPCTELPNKQLVIETPEGPWRPRNSEGESDPLLSMKCALAFSINRVAVYLSERLGRERVAAYANRFGIEQKIKPVPAVALGTTDVSVWEMTRAYATIASLGRSKPLVIVDSIVDASGRKLNLPEVKTEQVYPADKAYTLLDLMRGVVTFGTAGTIKRQYNLYNIDLAGKTGTTQNHSDGWFMNVTPELVTGIWVGCDDRRVRFEYMYYGRGAMTAMPIGGLFLSKVYADKQLKLPKGRFEPPAKLPWTTACAACPQFIEKVDSTATDSLNTESGEDVEFSLEFADDEADTGNASDEDGGLLRLLRPQYPN